MCHFLLLSFLFISHGQVKACFSSCFLLFPFVPLVAPQSCLSLIRAAGFICMYFCCSCFHYALCYINFWLTRQQNVKGITSNWKGKNVKHKVHASAVLHILWTNKNKKSENWFVKLFSLLHSLGPWGQAMHVCLRVAWSYQDPVTRKIPCYW